jgi:hypothetical protein
MFCSKIPVMSRDDQQLLFNDKAKIDFLVEEVAHYLANILQIKDDSISINTPFAEICRRELHYFTDVTKRGSVLVMKSLHKMYSFVQMCDNTATRIHNCAIQNYQHNIDINIFTSEIPYYYSDQLIDDRTNSPIINVGNIGSMLLVEIESRVKDWLDALDRVMCNAFNFEPTDGATKHKKLLKTKEELAYAIAERLTVMSYECVSNDLLSSNALESMLNGIYKNEFEYGSRKKQEDLHGMKMLLQLATDPTGEETLQIIENHLDTLFEIARSPPIEIERYCQHINLNTLLCALKSNIDYDFRMAMISFWANTSQNAIRALKKAITELEAWNPTQNVTTMQSILLKSYEDRKASNKLMIPPMSFLKTPRMFICKQPSTRYGLSESSKRAEILVQIVWEMASSGHFMPGVVSSEALIPITLESIVSSRMAAKTIADERDVNKLGFRMCAFVNELYNMEGNHKNCLDEASCYLSMFSCQEIETVFLKPEESIPNLCERLTKRTLLYMSYKPNTNYRSCVTDSIGILLPLLYKRRNRIGIPTIMRSNSLLDILKTVPKFNGWTPNNGTLLLSLDDIKFSHPLLREVLDNLSLSTNYHVVKRIGNSQNKKKIQYCFNTFILWNFICKHRWI